MKKRVAILTALVIIGVVSGMACTGISLLTKNKELIQARTIEWAEYNLNSKLVVSPAGTIYTSILPDSTTGLKWQAEYGFVGISVNTDQYIGEGLNEKGLSAGIFYFKDYGSLSQFEKGSKQNIITDIDFVRWALTNAGSVDELLGKLSRISIAPAFIDKAGVHSPTGHWRVADKSGKNIVIEIVNKGQIKIYDNIGVVTNSPGYDWQLINLSNYMNIQPGTIINKSYGSYNARALGAGTASLGLPGDITPPSRFVRAAFYLFNTPEYENPADAADGAFHILNNFDIPIGIEFATEDQKHIPDIPSATQWTSVADLTNLNFYYKSMYNSTIRKINIPVILRKHNQETYIELDPKTFIYKEVK